jgi:hypothetical protein
MSRLQKKPPAHKRGHPTLQNMNFFILLWVIFALLDPDPDPYSNYGSGSNGPIEYGSGSETLENSVLFFLFLWVIFALLDPDPATQINADPDPQPWLRIRIQIESPKGKFHNFKELPRGLDVSPEAWRVKKKCCFISILSNSIFFSPQKL